MKKNPSNQSGGWWDKLKNEPVMVLAVIVAVLVTAGLITVEDVTAFVALVFALVPIIGGAIARSKVTPVGKG